MELFAKIVGGFQLLMIFTKNLIVDDGLGLERPSGNHFSHPTAE